MAGVTGGVPADPHATPLVGGRPYRVVRRLLGGVPCLLELPPEGQAVTALCVVYHGAWATKEGKLGVYAALAAGGGGGDAAVIQPSCTAGKGLWSSVSSRCSSPGGG